MLAPLQFTRFPFPVSRFKHRISMRNGELETGNPKAAASSAPYTDLSMCRLFCFSLTYAQLSRMFGALQARCSTAQGGRAREAGSATLGSRIRKRISPERAEQASVSPFQGSSCTSSRPRVSAAARPSPRALLPRAFSAGSSYLDLYALNGDRRMFKNTEIRVRSRAWRLSQNSHMDRAFSPFT